MGLFYNAPESTQGDPSNQQALPQVLTDISSQVRNFSSNVSSLGQLPVNNAFKTSESFLDSGDVIISMTINELLNYLTCFLLLFTSELNHISDSSRVAWCWAIPEISSTISIDQAKISRT